MSALATWLDPMPLEAFRREHLGWRPLYAPPSPARRDWAGRWDDDATAAARDDLASLLGLPPTAVEAGLVAPVGTTGAADTVVVQLRGWSRWRIAPAGAEADDPMPGEQHRLLPGAVLYIPGG